jgi:hypothetical protein
MPPTIEGSVVTEDGKRIVTDEYGTTIVWQDVPRTETGGVLVGHTPLTLLPAIINRLRYLNHEPETRSRETSLAITHLEEALHWLQAREDRRASQGVLGMRAAHDDEPPIVAEVHGLGQ